MGGISSATLLTVLFLVFCPNLISAREQFSLEPPSPDALSMLSLGAVEMPTVQQLGGLPLRQQRGKADVTGLCLDHGCKAFIKMLKPGVCEASYKCAGCQMSSKFANAELTSQFCQDIRPPNPSALILTSGFYRGDSTLKGSIRQARRETARLEIEWANPDRVVDITHCAPDDYNEGQVNRIMSNPRGPPLSLHVRLVMSVAIMKVKQHIFNPDVELSIIYHPPSEDVNTGGRYTGGGRCHELQSKVEVGPKNTKLQDGEMANFVKSITVPWDRTGLTAENFEARLKCTSGIRNCDLSNYRFCFRVMCAEMPKDVATKLLMIQELRTKAAELPEVPEIPAELLQPLSGPPELLPLPPLPPLQQAYPPAEDYPPQQAPDAPPMLPPAILRPLGQGRLLGYRSATTQASRLGWSFAVVLVVLSWT